MQKWSTRKVYGKLCEYCSGLFETRENRTRFCSQKCSAYFFNRDRGPCSEEQKVKVSKSLKAYYKANPEKRIKGKEASKNAAKSTIGKYNEDPKNIFDMSHRTRSKIMDRLELSCFRCGWNEAKCDIHHIHGRKIKDPHSHDKLTVLCPNCHRLAEENKIDDKKIPTFEQNIGDRWKTVYYG